MDGQFENLTAGNYKHTTFDARTANQAAANTAESCPTCSALKTSQMNGRTRIEVPENFGLPQGETTQNQVAQAMRAAGMLAEADMPNPAESPNPALRPTGEMQVPQVTGTPPIFQEAQQPAPPTRPGQQFTTAELAGNVIPSAVGPATTPKNFTLAETDAANVAEIIDDQESEPARPPEPATENDCDKWATKYLQWLKDHGELKKDDVIILRCNNTTYEFSRATGGDNWNWVVDKRTVNSKVTRAVEDQLGFPYPSGENWSDPNDPNNFGAYWPTPQQNAKRDAQGKIVKKVLGTANNCGLLKLRLVEPSQQWMLTRKFHFEMEYVISDDNGRADAAEVESLRSQQQTAFLKELHQVAGEPAVGSMPATEPAWPTKDELISSIKSIMLPVLLARKYCACTPPCKMHQQVMGLNNIAIAVAPKAPFGAGRGGRFSAATTTRKPTKKDGYWIVKISSTGTAVISVIADVILDVWCTT